MTREETISLTDKEKELVQEAAGLMGVSFDDAATAMFAQGLARRSKKRTGRKPSNIKALRR